MLVLLAAASILTPTGKIAPADLQTCIGQPEIAADLDALGAMKASLSPSDWKDACRQAREANARRLSLAKAIREAGVSPLKEFQSSAQWIIRAKAATDPDAAKLFRLVFDAEMPRVSGSRSKTPIARGLSPAAAALYDGLRSNDGIAADAVGREWLRGTVKRRGWFTISRDGPDADRAAWLVVQHSDMDLAFKREMIAIIEPLALAGESRKAAFPSMYDRWAAAAHEPQRFGLQGACKAKGVWEPLPIEDPDQIDERRKQFGITQSFADYVAQASARCP